MSVKRIKPLFHAAKLIINNSGIGFGPQNIYCMTEITSDGIQYDVYKPRIINSRTILLVYGMTIAGEKEKRITRFAQALADSGLKVVVPNLPGLKSFRFESSDLVILKQIISSLNQEENSWLGVAAFSVGAGMALAVASQQATPPVDLMLLFSPYYSLETLKDSFITQLKNVPSNEKEWDHFIWWHLVLMYRQQENLGLSPDLFSQLTDLLNDYCSVASFDEKFSFYQNVVKKMEIAINWENIIDDRLCDQFSPKGKLSSYPGRLVIFHDPFDQWAPYKESQQIVKEFELNPKANSARLLISPLISHVSPQFTWRISDNFLAIDMMSELFR